MDDLQKKDIFELEEKIKNLKGFLKRYYEMLPEVCWMTEETQAKNLKSTKQRIKTAKKNLIAEGLLHLELAENGNRLNPKHILYKTYPILLVRRVEINQRYSPEDLDFYENFFYTSEIHWNLLQKYTAEEINSLSKLEKVQLYMDCGFIVIPAHYPIFDSEGGARCSCNKSYFCSHKGKHPKYLYKYLDSFNYEKKKAKYLKDFKGNPDLNIAFKVMGYSVLDIDSKNNGHKTLESLLAEDELEMKHILSTRRGNGFHYYADNVNLKNTAGIIGDGLDVRSECGVIIAAGSRHYSGDYYEWNEIGEVTTIPQHWVEESDYEETKIALEKGKLGNYETVKKKLKDIELPRKLTSDYVIRNGERELTLFKWGCSERGKGRNHEEIYDSLITIRDTYCEDGDEPITDEEIKDIAHSASKYLTNAQKRFIALQSRNN